MIPSHSAPRSSLPKGRSEAGEGRLAFIFWLVLAGLAVAAAVQYVPVLISANRYQDYLIEMAEKRYTTPTTRLEKELLERAQELQLPVDKDNIAISNNKKRISIRVEYTVPLDFMVYTYQWHKVHQVDRTIYRF